MKKLTTLQRRTLKWIARYIDKNGYAPTFREIAKNYGVQVGAIQDRVQALKRKGYLTVMPGLSRTIRIIKAV